MKLLSAWTSCSERPRLWFDLIFSRWLIIAEAISFMTFTISSLSKLLGLLYRETKLGIAIFLCVERKTAPINDTIAPEDVAKGRNQGHFQVRGEKGIGLKKLVSNST
jgi:hypothetical protein